MDELLKGRPMLMQFRGLLLETAQEMRTVTYGRLMDRFHLSRGKALTSTLGAVDRLESLLGGPGFAALVVRKDTGFPGGGFFCDGDLPTSLRRPTERSSDPRLSPKEKAFVRAQQKRIWRYYRKAR